MWSKIHASGIVSTQVDRVMSREDKQTNKQTNKQKTGGQFQTQKHKHK